MRSIVLAFAATAACLFGGSASAIMLCGPGCLVISPTVTPYATTTVAPLGGGEYRYAIQIGSSPATQVTDFYIPYFADMGIDFFNADFAGTYASYTVESDSIFGLGGEVLHYRFAPGSGTLGSLGNDQQIGFDAAFAGVEAPFESDLVDGNGNRTVYRGDPLIPGSPDTIAALDAANPVSEPGALAIFLSGLGLLLGLRRRGSGRPPAPALAA